MRAWTRRGLVAGAVTLAIAVPIGAYAATDDPPVTPSDSNTWTPPRLPGDVPDAVREAFDSAEMQALREEHRADMEALLVDSPEALQWFQESEQMMGQWQGEGFQGRMGGAGRMGHGPGGGHMWDGDGSTAD